MIKLSNIPVLRRLFVTNHTTYERVFCVVRPSEENDKHEDVMLRTRSQWVSLLGAPVDDFPQSRRVNGMDYKC